MRLSQLGVPMNLKALDALLSLTIRVLLALGALFVVLFVSSSGFRAGIPGYTLLRNAIYLLASNLNNDLREGFVWTSKLIQYKDLESFQKQCKVAGYHNGLLQWHSPVGTYWLPAEDPTTSLWDMAQVLTRNVYSYKNLSVRNGDIVLDCGAHVGSFVRRALDLGAFTVVAIEPSTIKIAALRKNFEREVQAGIVRLAQIGVWDREDKLWLSGPANMTNSFVHSDITAGATQGEWVRVTTIDALVDELRLPRVDFIKMDIEGAETRALLGARNTIRRFRPFLAIATEHTDNVAANARSVIRLVQQLEPTYRIGFGRYILKGDQVAAPMEVFFYH